MSIRLSGLTCIVLGLMKLRRRCGSDAICSLLLECAGGTNMLTEEL